MTRKIKKLLASFLALVMCVSTISTTAFAEGETAAPVSAQQIVDAGGTTRDENVTLTKTISGTDQENIFDITLTAETAADISSDVSVVLVVDVSNSMYENCAVCNGCDTCKSSAAEHTRKVRAEIAEEQILSFLNSYAESAGDTGNARNIAVVLFATQSWGFQDWTDVTDPDNLAALKTKIQALCEPNRYGTPGKNALNALLAENTSYSSLGGGTNMEGGLTMARNYLKTVPGGVGLSYAIMLSDGEPTVYTKASDIASSSTGVFTGYTNETGDAVNPADYDNIDALTDEVKAWSDMFYIISMGDADWLERKYIGGIETGKWLEQWADKDGVIDGTTPEAAEQAFLTIGSDITSTEAWAATDKMNAAKPGYIEFLGFYDKDGNYTEDTTLEGSHEEDGENTADFTGDTIFWNMAESGYSAVGSSYTYSLTYRVRLKNEAVGFVEGDSYDTNAAAELQYKVKNNDGYYEDTLEFAVPAVNGYLGEFSFKKVDDSENALAGAEFTLRHDEDCCGIKIGDQIVESNDEGVVSFTGIPSGHAYVLTESETPDGYLSPENNSWSVAVAFGAVTVDGVEDIAAMTVVNAAVVVDEPEIPVIVEVPLTITKVETGSSLPERQSVYQIKVMVGESSDALALLSTGTKYTVAGEEKFVAEAGIIELKADETAELAVLAGTSYRVEEVKDTAYSYRTSYENAEGTIAADPVEVTVINEYIVPDAAVTLTVDMSGTMYRYKMDSKRYVDVAKAKALDFVNQYAASAVNPSDKRMLAIACFDTDAKVVLNWVDVNTAAGLDAAKTAINNMKVVDNGNASSNYVCTNFDGGIILTRNMMKQDAVKGIEKKFAIILSDGAPTVTVNSDTDTVGTIKSSFWGDQLDASGKKYQNARYGGGWTHPAEVSRTLSYLATGQNNLADLTVNYRTKDSDTKEGIFIIGVGGDMSVKLFNDAVYGTSNGTRTTDVKKKPAAFNNVEALAGYTQAEIMAMTTGQWLENLANKVGGTYESAANSAALQSEFDKIIEVIKDVTNP